MNTSIIVGSLALVLAGLLVAGHAVEQDASSVGEPVASEVRVKS